MATIVTPYATAMEFVKGALPSKFNGEYDGQRVASYDLYDDLFASSPSTYSLMLRGSDDLPIYIPTAKRMVNALSRYVGKGWGYAARPLGSDVSGEQGADPTGAPQVDSVAYTASLDAMDALFRRENLLSVFNSSKKGFLRRGDWCWYLSADPDKDQGTRISVQVIDPRTYFPLLEDPKDPYRVTAQQIVEETMVGDTLAYDVQLWIRPGHPTYQGDGVNIQYEHSIWDQKDYSDPAKRKLLVAVEPLETIEGITSLPIYHIRNNEDPENPFGTSDYAGLETLFAGINQAVTDEDMALALSGLGMYWTDGGGPVDENGQSSNWVLGPNQVVEVGSGKKFGRLAGVTSIQPSQDHIKYLEDQVFRTVGLSDVALGTADAPEAGIALAMKLQPVADVAAEKNLTINGVMTQMLHDLATQWFPVYEGIQMAEVVEFTSTCQGDLLPFDRDGRFLELAAMYTNGWVTIEWVLDQLRDTFGYTIPADMAEKALEAASTKASQAAALADPYAARAGSELPPEDEDNSGAVD